MKILFCLVLAFLISTQEKTSIDSVLEHPFDLQKFKKAKGPSNSGLADVQPYYYKPEGKGRYFYFFLFRSSKAFRFSENGDKKIPVRSGSGFQIVTYKPDGKYQNDYFDPTEALIEVTASYNDEDLPELALVGLDTLTIQMKFGNDFIRKDNCFIYSRNSNVLTLRITEGIVQCLRYAKLKPGITEATLPKELTIMKCENKPVR